MTFYFFHFSFKGFHSNLTKNFSQAKLCTYSKKGFCMINEVIAHFGSQAALAQALGVTEGAVSQWVSSGVIPSARAVQIERITDGKFKAIDWSK